MAKTAGKKISIESLKERDAKVYKQKKITIDGFEVNIEAKFRKSKLADMINELVLQQDFINKNELGLNVGEYMLLLLIKYFTDIDVPSDFKEQIELFSLLVDNEMLEPIMSAFDTEEINKALETMNKSISSAYDQLSKLNQTIEEEAKIQE